MTIDHLEIQQRFYPNETNSDQDCHIRTLRGAYEILANDILIHTPPGREQSLALTQLEQSAFWAVKAITREDSKS